MARPISRKSAIALALGFLVVGFIVGAYDVIPENVRTAMAYPILVFGMLLALWDLWKNEPRFQSVAGALLTVVGSVIVGYRSTAQAMQEPVLAIFIFMAIGAGLFAVTVPLALLWVRYRTGDPSPFSEVSRQNASSEGNEGRNQG